MNKWLFVSYSHKGSLGYGPGYVILEYSKPVVGAEDMKEITRLIKQYSLDELGQRLDEVSIVSWQRMET